MSLADIGANYGGFNIGRGYHIRRVAEKYHPNVIRATKTQLDSAQLGSAKNKALVVKLLKNKNNQLLSEVGHGPRIRLSGMDIEGPHFDQWPPESHRLVFGSETNAAKIDINRLVLRLASRALRQPVEPGDVKHYADTIASSRSRLRLTELPHG